MVKFLFKLLLTGASIMKKIALGFLHTIWYIMIGITMLRTLEIHLTLSWLLLITFICVTVNLFIKDEKC